MAPYNKPYKKFQFKENAVDMGGWVMDKLCQGQGKGKYTWGGYAWEFCKSNQPAWQPRGPVCEQRFVSFQPMKKLLRSGFFFWLTTSKAKDDSGVAR